jgi:osmoprotectant transport system substrate-binding protein
MVLKVLTVLKVGSNMKHRYLIVATVSAAALTLAACGSSGSSSRTSSAPASASSGSATGSVSYPAGTGSIIVGSQDFPESQLLADIYGAAMAAKGNKVSYKPGISARATELAALHDGSVNFVPEFTGSVLDYYQSGATQKTPADVFAALPSAMPGTDLGLTYAAAQDADTITVTQATATKDKLKTIGDLSSVASSLTLGGPAQFQTRADGIPALKTVYNVVFGRFTALDTGGPITIAALKNGSVDAADIFSTDPSIAANNFVSLTDDKSMFAAQNVFPLATKAKLTQTMVDASNAVSAKLDTATLAALDAKVITDKQDPNAVAQAWLKTAGLS